MSIIQIKIKNSFSPYIVDFIFRRNKDGRFKGEDFSEEFSDRFGGDMIDHFFKEFRSDFIEICDQLKINDQKFSHDGAYCRGLFSKQIINNLCEITG